jgi:BirA family biotin operon repressor/biotin-[acetyl-CoA-carboxylase] ligase
LCSVHDFRDGLVRELDRWEGRSESGEPAWVVDVVPRTGSTNTDAVAEVRAGARQAYSVLIALDQVAGKGRLDRQWEAPAGSALFLSMVVPIVADSAHWGVMPLVAGLAVQRGLSALARDYGAVSAPARATLKWPNDVLLCGGGVDEPMKVCGVLLETVRDKAVIGVGVNVSQTKDRIVFPRATSLALCGLGVSREQVAAAVLRQVGELWPLLATQGGRDQALAEYRRSCDTIGRQVRVYLDQNTSVEGGVCDVADDGELLVNVEGTARRFASGDVYHLR